MNRLLGSIQKRHPKGRFVILSETKDLQLHEILRFAQNDEVENPSF